MCLFLFKYLHNGGLSYLFMSSDRCRDWICLVRFHQNFKNFNRQPNRYDVTINTLHRVGMSYCAHFGIEFTEKPTKNQFSELQTVTSDSKILA